ncbi:nucleotidyltransferase family protein [Guggenheimella bovis]
MIDELIISPDRSVLDAMQKLDRNARKILYVVEGSKLVGSVTDGDIRRWILKEGSLNSPVREAMYRGVKYVIKGSLKDPVKFMKEHEIESVPVVNENLEIKDIVFLHEKRKPVTKKKNQIVIMAGGKGTRLNPYTKVLPKPLIPIGDKPIVERIMDRFLDQGYERFILSLNYKKDMIKAYFNESNEDYQVSFVEEDTPLGTAGSLSLMTEIIDGPFFVTNCDILIRTDYDEIRRVHEKNKNLITLVLAKRDTTIPYGVVELKEDRVIAIKEKPSFTHFTSTGMYLMEPEVLKEVPSGRDYPMTELLEWAIEQGRLGAFIIGGDDWLDMGELPEMHSMIERLGL